MTITKNQLSEMQVAITLINLSKGNVTYYCSEIKSLPSTIPELESALVFCSEYDTICTQYTVMCDSIYTFFNIVEPYCHNTYMGEGECIFIASEPILGDKKITIAAPITDLLVSVYYSNLDLQNTLLNGCEIDTTNNELSCFVNTALKEAHSLARYAANTSNKIAVSLIDGATDAFLVNAEIFVSFISYILIGSALGSIYTDSSTNSTIIISTDSSSSGFNISNNSMCKYCIENNCELLGMYDFC